MSHPPCLAFDRHVVQWRRHLAFLAKMRRYFLRLHQQCTCDFCLVYVHQGKIKARPSK